MQPERRQEAVEHAGLRQDQAPGVDLDEVAAPEGQQDRHDQDAPGARRGHSRDVERDREAHDDAGQRHERRHQERAERDRPVDVGRRDGDVVAQRRRRDDVPGEGIDRPERADEEERERSQVGDQQPAERGGEQQPELGSRSAVQRAGQGPQPTCGAGQVRGRQAGRRHVAPAMGNGPRRIAGGRMWRRRREVNRPSPPSRPSSRRRSPCIGHRSAHRGRSWSACSSSRRP